MKKLFITLLMTFFSLCIHASNAYPFPMNFVQSDGTTVTVRLHGNEYFHYMTTLDSVLVVKTYNGIFVAEISDNNELVATNILAHNKGERTSEEIDLIATQDVDGYINQGLMQANALRAKPVIPQSSPANFPHMGNPKVLVFLVDFANCKFSVADPINNFRQFLNGEGHGNGAMKDFYTSEGVTFHESHLYGSVAEYFDCMSYGKFRPKFEVMDDIIHLTKKVGDYGSSENMTNFLRDICNEANKNEAINFSLFDEDNDNYCDLVYIIFAGQSENVGGAASTIWAKSGWLNGCGPYDGKYVAHYGVSGELALAPSYIDGIGVFCHEFSHALGLPDFYNTANTSDMSSNQGMEYWSLLDWGMYLNNGLGSCPCPYTAWERYDMGWMDIPTIKEDGHYKVMPREKDSQCAYIIENPENDNEYFVLESAQKKEWGSGMFGHGLMVTHVTFDSNAFNVRNNFVNTNSKHPRMTVIPADGDLLSTNKAEYMSELRNAAAKDLFSEANGRTELSRDCNLPNFDWFTNATNKTVSSSSATYPNYVRIYNIQENSDGSIEFDVILNTNNPNNINISDGRYFSNANNKFLQNISYTRTFTNSNWQALYVPFSMSYNDWKDDFEVAYINDVHQYDDDEDGTIDRTDVEVIKLKEGKSIEPNTPYLIKAKTTGEKTITLENATLYKTEENAYDVTSWFTRFNFIGTYHTISNMATKGYYAMAEGTLKQATSNAVTLNPFRWYLSVTDRNGNAKPLNSKSINIVFDDGETTGIENVNNEAKESSSIHTLTGISKGNDAKTLAPGIYIKNGKKFIVK